MCRFPPNCPKDLCKCFPTGPVENQDQVRDLTNSKPWPFGLLGYPQYLGPLPQQYSNVVSTPILYHTSHYYAYSG